MKPSFAETENFAWICHCITWIYPSGPKPWYMSTNYHNNRIICISAGGWHFCSSLTSVCLLIYCYPKYIHRHCIVDVFNCTCHNISLSCVCVVISIYSFGITQKSGNKFVNIKCFSCPLDTSVGSLYPLSSLQNSSVCFVAITAAQRFA